MRALLVVRALSAATQAEFRCVRGVEWLRLSSRTRPTGLCGRCLGLLSLLLSPLHIPLPPVVSSCLPAFEQAAPSQLPRPPSPSSLASTSSRAASATLTVVGGTSDIATRRQRGHRLGVALTIDPPCRVQQAIPTTSSHWWTAGDTPSPHHLTSHSHPPTAPPVTPPQLSRCRPTLLLLLSLPSPSVLPVAPAPPLPPPPPLPRRSRSVPQALPLSSPPSPNRAARLEPRSPHSPAPPLPPPPPLPPSPLSSPPLTPLHSPLPPPSPPPAPPLPSSLRSPSSGAVCPPRSPPRARTCTPSLRRHLYLRWSVRRTGGRS